MLIVRTCETIRTGAEIDSQVVCGCMLGILVYMKSMKSERTKQREHQNIMEELLDLRLQE